MNHKNDIDIVEARDYPMYLARLLALGFSFLLSSGPGIGKTARIAAACALSGRRMFYGIGGRTCDLMDRLDAAGAVVPVPSQGVSKVLPLEALLEVLDCEEPAVWFLDEIGRAPLDVQGALCSQIDYVRRERPNITVVAATNRPQDGAGVAKVSEQLRSRFAMAFEIATPSTEEAADGAVLLAPWACGDSTCGECELCGWLAWAMDNGAPSESIAWHRSTRGRTLYTWRPHGNPAVRMSDFRTWEQVHRAWNAGLRGLRDIGAIVGKPVAAEYLAYARLADQLPTPEQVRLDPTGATVPTDPAPLYLIASTLAQAVDETWIDPFITYIERLPRIYAALCGRDAYRRLKGKLAGSKAWGRWFTANADLFSVGGSD